MKFLTLEYIKKHSRIDFDCDDDILAQYAEDAEETLAGILNRGDTVEEMVESLESQYGKIPSSLYVAGQMLVDISYTHRSPVSPTNMSVVPYTLELKIKRYIIL